MPPTLRQYLGPGRPLSSGCKAVKRSKRSSTPVVQVRLPSTIPMHLLSVHTGRFEIVKKTHEIAVLSLPKVAWRTGDAVTGSVAFHAPGSRFDVLKVRRLPSTGRPLTCGSFRST